MLRSIGAELVADDTRELAAGLERLVGLNVQVCRPYYDPIVAAAVAEVRILFPPAAVMRARKSGLGCEGAADMLRADLWETGLRVTAAAGGS